MDEDLLSKIVYEQVQKLNEELSVSDDVKRVSYEVIDELEKKYKNGDAYNSYRRHMSLNGVIRSIIVNSYAIEHKLAGVKVSYSITIYDLPDKSYVDENLLDAMSSWYNGHKMMISITTFNIENESIRAKNIFNPIFHETLHAYQDIMSETIVGSDRYKAADTLTNSANIAKLNNKYGVISNVELIRNLAYAIYYLDRHEIEANIHGLYSELSLRKDDDGLSIFDRVCRTNFNVYLNDVVEKMMYLQEYGGNIDNVTLSILKNEFNFNNMNQCMSYLKRQYNYLQKKRAKVIQLVSNEDKLNEMTINGGRNNKVKLYIR